MPKPTLSDYVQNQDQPSQTISRSPIPDSVLQQFQTITSQTPQIKPGYNYRSSNISNSEFKLLSNQKDSRILKEIENNYYQSVADNSKAASPPLTEDRNFEDKIKDFLRKESKQDYKILKQINDSFRRVSQKMSLFKDNCLFEIRCSSSRFKKHKKEEYVIFCEDIDSKKYSTCIQENNQFKYYMGGEEIYQMEFKKDCYYLKPSHSHKVSPYKFYHKNQRKKINSSNVNVKHKPVILFTSCHYQNKNIESKPIKYNSQFHVPYISSESFDLKNTTPSMLNTLIIDSVTGAEICAIYEREGKIYVEFGEQAEILKNVVLMMAVSRIDFRRKSCTREER